MTIAAFWKSVAGWVWGLPTVILLVGTGVGLFGALRMLPLTRIPHAIDVVRGKYDDPDDPGELSHFQALCAALAATLGLGNIAGVAIAVATGGPGAVFWMWIAGLAGMATKFCTCTLACLYRRPDSRGIPQGGPMYFIEVGLGPRFRPLAIMFSVSGMVGCLALFQINQLSGLMEGHYAIERVVTGAVVTVGVGAVVLGGITRIGRAATGLVPLMALLYFAAAIYILAVNFDAIPAILLTIIDNALTGGALVGGAAGVTVKQALITGVRRAAFSNEAGLGTAAMAHGAAKTREPVREGLTAMLGPFIDTNIVCTLTALVILSTGVNVEGDGVMITTRAFESAMPSFGGHLLAVIIVLFSVSTLMSYSYYSVKCATYVFGERWGARYVYVYLGTIFFGAMWSQGVVVDIVDTAFGLMAVPTLIATLLLSPRVLVAVRDYFARVS